MPDSADNLSETKALAAKLAPQWVLIVCSVAVITASQFIRIAVPREFRVIPLLMVPVSLVLFYLGIRTAEKDYLPGWFRRPLEAIAAWLHISSGQVISLFFSLLFSLLTPVAAGFAAHMYNLPAADICWLAGIVLAVYGGFTTFDRHQPISRSALLSGAVLFILALLLRSFNTDTIPAVLTGDEASSGLSALTFLDGKADNLFVGGWFSFPSFHNFLQSISIFVFGQTTQALRLLAAFGGALTVALVFFIGRSMFGLVPGLIAAIFLTGMHFHNHFSRIGLNNIWDGFFLVLTLGFLWVGWKKDSRTAYLVAGLGLGLAQYFYTTSRILFLIIPLWLVMAGLSDRRRLRKSIPDFFLMLWVALIVILPLGWFYIKHPDEFLAPMNRVSIIGDWLRMTVNTSGRSPFLIVLDQIWQGCLGFVGLPLRAWYTPGVPMLRTLPGIVFLLGLVFMLIHPKDSRSQLLFIWLAMIAVTGGLSESTPAAQRYVAAAPAAALLIAFCLQRLGNLAEKHYPKRIRWIQAVILMISLLLAADDLRFYYFDFTQNNDFGGFNGEVAQNLANRLQSEPTGQELVFFGYPQMGYHSISSLPYLAPQIKYYDVNIPWGSSDDPQPMGDRVLFAFLPDHETDQTEVQQDFPGGVWTDFYSKNGTVLFRLYETRKP